MTMQRPLVLAFGLATGVLVGCVADEGFGGELQMRGAELEPQSCTHTQGYWKTHNIYAEQDQKKVPWPIWEDNPGCGDTWYAWMTEVPAGGDHWLNLAHQWMTARLNQVAGVHVPADVQNAMWAAQSLLDPCEIADEDVEEASELTDTLDAYNNGLLGPAHCE